MLLQLLLPVGGASAAATTITSSEASRAAPSAAALALQGPARGFQGRAQSPTPAPLRRVLNINQLGWVQYPDRRRSKAVATATGPPLEDERLPAPPDGADGGIMLEPDGRGGTCQQLGLALWAVSGKGGGGQVPQAQGKPLHGVVCDLLAAGQVQVLQRTTHT